MDIEALYAEGRAAVLSETLVADLETPVSAYLKLAESRAGDMFLLESVEGGASRGRYSMIGLDPDLIFRVVGERAEINRAASRDRDAFQPCAEPPLAALRALLAESRIDLPAGLPPMSAGVFGYLGYDMVRRMERLPPAKPDLIGVPDALLIRPRVMVVFDSVRDEITVVTPIRPTPGVTAKAAIEAGQARLDAVVAALEGPLSNAPPEADPHLAAEPPVSNTTEAEFRGMVSPRPRIHPRRRRLPDRAVAAFHQPVRTARVLALPRAAPGEPLALSLLPRFRRVPDRGVEPGNPRQAARGEGDHPPDRRHALEGRDARGRLGARRGAARRPQGAGRAFDAARPRPQRRRPRRQDRHGQGDRQFLRRALQPRDAHRLQRRGCELRRRASMPSPRSSAGFPAGTVSGAPKVRAMEIIDELEKDKRGIYAGCIGYFGAGGEMDTCIVLRASVVKDGEMHVQAGAGIVYDSDPASEHRECVNKAKALFRAAEEAVRFATRAKRGQ